MKLFILSADNSKEIDKISGQKKKKKFKIREKQDNYILMRKRRFGNLVIHAICLIIALSVFGLAIFINVVYFTYSYLWASPHVLITTETQGEEGEELEFNTMDEVLDKATAIL